MEPTTFDAAVMLFSWLAVAVVVFGIGGLICERIDKRSDGCLESK
tara:strand:+ start:194 stop:328 length:135 start_codon:yes stop_codon:yes gene_type:complete